MPVYHCGVSFLVFQVPLTPQFRMETEISPVA